MTDVRSHEMVDGGYEQDYYDGLFSYAPFIEQWEFLRSRGFDDELLTDIVAQFFYEMGGKIFTLDNFNKLGKDGIPSLYDLTNFIFEALSGKAFPPEVQLREGSPVKIESRAAVDRLVDRMIEFLVVKNSGELTIDNGDSAGVFAKMTDTVIDQECSLFPNQPDSEIILSSDLPLDEVWKSFLADNPRICEIFGGLKLCGLNPMAINFLANQMMYYYRQEFSKIAAIGSGDPEAVITLSRSVLKPFYAYLDVLEYTGEGISQVAIRDGILFSLINRLWSEIGITFNHLRKSPPFLRALLPETHNFSRADLYQ